MAELRRYLRILNTDIDGNKRLLFALRAIKGVSYSYANAICNVLGIDKLMKAGELNNEEIEKIEDAIKNPSKYGIPSWLYNRRKDIETGEDIHLVKSDLSLKIEDDIKRLRKIRSYRGIRHELGLPVRGQRTKAHFRKGRTIGVIRKKSQQKAKK